MCVEREVRNDHKKKLLGQTEGLDGRAEAGVLSLCALLVG